MAKFVIYYSTGEYDTCMDHNIAIEAESKEAIKDAILKAIVNYSLMKNEEARIRALRDEFKSYDEWWKLWIEFVDKSDLYSLNVDGNLLPNADDIYRDPDPIQLFEIYTLDEWFEANRAHKE